MSTTTNSTQLIQMLKAHAMYCPECSTFIDKNKDLILPTAHIGQTSFQSAAIFKGTKEPHPQIKNLIAIGSGKGGVGKSTITYLLAHALTQMGLKVGILDADIYGPSQALLHQTTTTPDVKDGLITPLDRQNVQLMSIALISPTDKALNWRGPMIAKALLQMFIQTDWDALDYLLVDLPPGTGDIQMSLCQQLPITGYVSVTHIHPLSIETTSRFEKAMQLMSVPQIIKIYNQSPQESIHHIPYTPQYQNLQPAVDQQILKLATCFALRMNQLPILSTQHRS